MNKEHYIRNGLLAGKAPQAVALNESQSSEEDGSTATESTSANDLEAANNSEKARAA